MKRTGNTIGAEGRRQHGQNDPKGGDLPRRQERLADAEIEEGREELAREGTGESLETAPQADGVPAADEDVDAPEGTKPGTRRGIEDADPEEEH